MSGSPLVRKGLGIFIFLLIYDGALRKWALPAAEQILFILKDVILTGVVAYLLMPGARRIVGPKLPPLSSALLFLYSFWVIVEAFNINLPNVAVGLWGIKSHLLYATLLLLLPVAFQDLKSVILYLEKAYPWLVIPPCLVAFLQLASPPDSFINQQVRGGLEMISYFGDQSLVRVAGPFSYISGMAAFVQVSTIMGVGLFIIGARSRKFLIAVSVVLMALPITGSRSVIAVTAVSLVIMVLASRISGLLSFRMTAKICGALAALTFLSFFVQDDAWVALQERTRIVASNENDSIRAVTTFTNAFDFFEVAGLVGYGTGAANLGAPALAPSVEPFSWLPRQYFEEESGRIVLEIGIVGWFLSLLMRFSFLVWSVKTVFCGCTKTIRAAGIISLPVVAYGVHSGNGVFAAPIASCFYWLCIALLALARKEQYQDRCIRQFFKSECPSGGTSPIRR